MKENDPTSIQNGNTSVPFYRKWYSSPKMASAVRGGAMMWGADPEAERDCWKNECKHLFEMKVDIFNYF